MDLINSPELYKSNENNVNLEKDALRTFGEFDAAPSGLRNSGKHTIIAVNDTTWTALPSVALLNRNAIAIQNNSDTDIKVNYSDSVVGYTGMTIRKNGAERQYDIKDTILLYAKSESGTVFIDIEELS